MAPPEPTAHPLASVLAALPDGVLAADVSGTVWLANPAAVRLIGRPTSELVGRPLSDVFADGVVHTLDGRPLAAETVPAGDGSLVLIRAAEGRFRQLADAIPQIVWTASAEGAVEYLSDRWAELTGRAATNRTGTEAAIHPDDLPQMAARWAEARRTGRPFEGEFRLRMADGSYRWFLGRAVRGPAGDWVGTSTDIDALKRAEARFQASEHTLAALLQLQDEATAAGADRQAVYDAAARHALTIAGASGAAVEDQVGDRLVYRTAVGAIATHVGLTVGLDGSLSGRCLVEGRPLVCDDSETDPRVDRAACRTVGCRSLAVVPLVRRGRTEGVLKVTAGRPGAFGPDTLLALRLAAAATSAGLAGVAEAVAEDAARAADGRLADLVRGMSEACFVLAPDWRFTFVNDRCETLMRQSRGQMLGHRIWDVFGRLAGTSVEQLFRQVMDDRSPAAFVVFSPAAERWLDVRLFPSGDGLAAFLLDIHDRKLAEDEVRRLNADLEARVKERTAELEAFSYTVSHDLRGPLRAVEGFARIAERDYGPHLPPAGRERLADIRAAARRMDELIDAVLTLSRLGRQPLRRRPVDVAAMVRDCLAELRAADPGRAVEVHVGELPPADADPRLLRRVWANLLGNALKYTAGRDPARVEVGADGPTYFVRDNGAGFDMRYAGKLFGVFQRLHRAEDFPGTGVGLAVVRRVVERHGGRVWAEAEPGRGACFSFTLSNEPSASTEGDTLATPVELSNTS